MNSYIGESNANWNRHKYGCAFKQMITDWRRLWSTNTETNPNFPFGFMQLSTNSANDPSTGFPMIRWYQTGGYGYVPNESLQVDILE